jgi:putative NADH-flavin reductase
LVRAHAYSDSNVITLVDEGVAMNIVLFGTGFVGGGLLAEFASRGHQVTAVSRAPKGDLPAGVASVTGSVYDADFLNGVIKDADIVVSALPALSPEGGVAAAVKALIAAAHEAGVRLGVVGGAAILPFADGGPRVGDTPGFPAELAPLVDAHQQALDALRAAPEDVDWFSFIPAGEFGPQNPGSRKGTYRTSSTSLVTTPDGHSDIGLADFATAFADEIETPRTHRAYLTVGY